MMTMWIPLLVTLAVSFQLSDAARRVNLEHHISKRSVHFRRSNPDQVLGLREGEHLQPGNKIRTAKGTTKLKMQETYKGIPVVGESVVVEMDEDGRYTGHVTGRLLEGIEEDIPSVEPAITADEALDKALAYSGDNRNQIQFNPFTDARLQIDVKGHEDVHARLVYQVNYRIETKSQISRPTFLIDANTGHVLKNWNAMTMANWRHRAKRRANTISNYELVEGVGGNVKIGKYLFGLDLPSLKVSVAPDGRCALENQFAIVYNCNESYDCSLENVEPHQFDCDVGNNDTVNDAYSPLNDALFYVGLTYEMYSEWYEISDILQNGDLNGGRCPTRVHFGHLFENAFWDGEVITFGDGESTMYPLTSLNVVAHEISHGFTEKNSGLIYAGESGGMNEAFSDMAGEAAEDFLKHKIDWMVGFAIWKKKNESMRYFDDPPKDGRSIAHFKDFCFDMDPHLSSGIYNRAFYILSNRPGWCVRKAFHIFVVANDIYWRPNSNFHDAACDVQRAADDLGYNVQDVTYAFRQVGIEPCSEKHQNDLGSVNMLKNMSSISFKINNAHDEELDYLDLIVLAMGAEPFALKVETENFVYNVAPTEDNMYRSAITLPLGRQCYNSDCTITLSTEVENTVMTAPIAMVKSLVAGVTLKAQDNSYDYVDDSDVNTGNESFTTPTPTDEGLFTMSFEVPEIMIKHGFRVMFIGTAEGSDRHTSYFIRHEELPNLDSYEYDVQGSLNGEPAMLCKPREGTYHIAMKAGSEDVEFVNIKIGVWMKGETVGEEEQPGTAMPS